MVERVAPRLEQARALAQVLHRHGRRRFACPDRACRGRLLLKRGAGRWFWGCDRFSACKETWPADQETGDPVGTPTDRETRAARGWLTRSLQRWGETLPGGMREAVERLNTALPMPLNIEHFDAVSCQRASTALSVLWRAQQVAEDLRAAAFGAPGDPLLGRAPKARRRAAKKPVAAARPWADAEPGKRRVLLEDDNVG